MLLKGIGVSTGVARGTAYVLVCARNLAVARRALAEAEVADELDRFEAALAKAEAELFALEKSVAERLGSRDANIFGAQALLVRSSRLVEPVRSLVRDERLNVEAALLTVIERLVQSFDGVADAGLRERAADIRDVGKRVLARLMSE